MKPFLKCSALSFIMCFSANISATPSNAYQQGMIKGYLAETLNMANQHATSNQQILSVKQFTPYLSDDLKATLKKGAKYQGYDPEFNQYSSCDFYPLNNRKDVFTFLFPAAYYWQDYSSNEIEKIKSTLKISSAPNNVVIAKFFDAVNQENVSVKYQLKCTDTQCFIDDVNNFKAAVNACIKDKSTRRKK
ncbi:hypothetical protein [Lonepinella sp. BR2474]|uniref:hypothetical protein n=1 Tax=Lonepinella sp. BR2474 TaxID=3434548 RepID=UPI003F6E02EB